MHFGLYDPVGDAKHQLRHLSLKVEQCISKYVVEFNHLACQLRGYGDGTLQHLFYSRLLDCIKDEISCVGKLHPLLDLPVLAQSIDVHYWEHKFELNHQTFITGHTTSIMSAPTFFSTMPSNSKLISGSISDSGHPDPSSNLPDPHSFIFENSEDSDSEAAEPTFELGPDEKLSAVEHQQCFNLKLCLVCALAGHKMRDCSKTSHF